MALVRRDIVPGYTLIQPPRAFPGTVRAWRRRLAGPAHVAHREWRDALTEAAWLATVAQGQAALAQGLLGWGSGDWVGSVADGDGDGSQDLLASAPSTTHILTHTGPLAAGTTAATGMTPCAEAVGAASIGTVTSYMEAGLRGSRP